MKVTHDAFSAKVHARGQVGQIRPAPGCTYRIWVGAKEWPYVGGLKAVSFRANGQHSTCCLHQLAEESLLVNGELLSCRDGGVVLYLRIHRLPGAPADAPDDSQATSKLTFLDMMMAANPEHPADMQVPFPGRLSFSRC